MKPRSFHFRTIDCDETAETVKTGYGEAQSMHVINLHTDVLYVKLYDHASPTVGTTTPIQTYGVPAQSSGLGGGFTFDLKGMMFVNGLSVACTTGIGDDDTTGPAANKCLVNILYE